MGFWGGKFATVNFEPCNLAAVVSIFLAIFNSPGRSPGRAIVLSPALASVA